MAGIRTTDSAEQSLLIKTARLNIDDKASNEIREIIKSGVDWENVINESVRHGTAGLLYKNLSDKRFRDDVPAQVIEKLKKTYLYITASGMKQIGYFKPLAVELASAGIDIIILKGADLAESLYGDLGLRPFSDIDILVKEKDWPEVFRILKKNEFRPAEKEFNEVPPKLTKYDVQTHMQYISPGETVLEFQFDLLTLGIGMCDIEGVWDRSRKSVIGDAEVRTLSSEDLILHLAVHTNRHGFMKLKWLVDIAETLRQRNDIDWDRVVEIAETENLKTSFYMTVRYIEKIFDCRLLPGDIYKKLEPRANKKFLWRLVWPEEHLNVFEGRKVDGACFCYYRLFSGWNLVNFLLMGRVKDKLAYQTRWILPSLTWMAKNYNKEKKITLLKYYPIRMVDYKIRKKKTR